MTNPHAVSNLQPADAIQSWQTTVKAYITLTKPRIIELLLITTVPTMILAQRGWPGIWPIIATVIGGTLAAGSANTYNMWYDRDIDAKMRRTKRRPLVTGAVTPRNALIFASILALASVLWLGFLVNWLSAGLALAANAMYSIGYTILLKRHTAQNIVWGGAAGCMPVLIGWSAVTNSLAWPALILFLIIFFWTPPHYWPLSMRFKDDYANAGVPMLPVVASNVKVAFNILIYTALMLISSFALIPLAQMGPFYTVMSIGAGAWFLYLCVRLYQSARAGVRKLQAMKVFHASITYLSIVFIAVAIDPFINFW